MSPERPPVLKSGPLFELPVSSVSSGSRSNPCRLYSYTSRRFVFSSMKRHENDSTNDTTGVARSDILAIASMCQPQAIRPKSTRQKKPLKQKARPVSVMKSDSDAVRNSLAVPVISLVHSEQDSTLSLTVHSFRVLIPYIEVRNCSYLRSPASQPRLAVEYSTHSFDTMLIGSSHIWSTDRDLALRRPAARSCTDLHLMTPARVPPPVSDLRIRIPGVMRVFHVHITHLNSWWACGSRRP